MTDQPISFDAIMPPGMAAKAEDIGVKKAALPALNMFFLAILAGAFIAIGAIFATTVSAGSMAVKDAAGAAAFSTGFPYGVTRLLAGLVFTVGLILVVVGGSELFTGNNLIVMAFADKKVTLGALLRNWAIVYLGNLAGALGTVVLIVVAGQYLFGGGEVGKTALDIGAAKVGYDFGQAFTLGVLCNALVCLAVWLTYMARSTTDKVLVIVPPIAAFVAMGFEHSVANMYFIPVAMLIRAVAPETFWSSIGAAPDEYSMLDLGGLMGNLVPVTLGNIVGGTILVGAVYWLVYLRPRAEPTRPSS